MLMIITIVVVVIVLVLAIWKKHWPRTVQSSHYNGMSGRAYLSGGRYFSQDQRMVCCHPVWSIF